VAGISIIALAANTSRADALEPGQVDFGTFKPDSSTEFIEVNVPSSLINLAAKFVEKQEPEVAKLLHGLKLVRVNVVGLTDDNKSDLEKRVSKVRNELSGRGWERLVTVQKEGQDVGIFMKMDKDSAVQGLAVTLIEAGKQAVFVNVVGDIKPEQLTMLGERLNIDQLKDLPPRKSETEKSAEAEK
jgi:hypothetical protein